MPGTWLPSLVWEDPTCYGAIKPVCHNYWSLHLESRRRQWHPLQYSCLENPMGGGAWWAAVHGVAKSQTRLSNLTFTFHFHALEKEMAVHSSILAWRIPGTGEPGGLQSVGSHRVGHDWSDAATVHCVYIPELSYPFVCQWTSRLLSCPCYCQQCRNEQWGTRVSFNSSFFGVYAQQWDCWVIRQFYFQFFKESPHCST